MVGITKSARRRLRRRKLALKFPVNQQLAQRQSAPKSTDDYSAEVPDPPTSFSRVHTFRSHTHPCSNFYMCNIVLDGVKYQSTEHAYQTLKCLTAGNRELADKVKQAKTAARAKRLSWNLDMSKDVQDAWFKIRVQVMKRVLECKFQRCAQFRSLISKGNEYFVESTQDDFWACGVSMPSYRNIDPRRFKGQNVLGRLITCLARNRRL